LAPESRFESIINTAVGELLDLFGVGGLVVAGGIVSAIVVWFVPKLQIRRSLERRAAEGGEAVGADRRFELEDQARKTWAQLVGGLALVIGFIFTYQNVLASQQAQETARETQFANSFATATDDLAAPDIEARLGGIYALERLAEDSSDPDNDFRRIREVVEVLSAYVRKHAPAKAEAEILPAKAGAPDPPPKAPAADVQAIITVLGRQTRTPVTRRKGVYIYPLYQTDLRYANLHEADFRQANLWRTNLQGADLSKVKLQGAYLGEANLQGANLSDTNLKNADLTGADLRQAKNLSQKQIDQTRHGDQTTLLPLGLEPAPDWGQELDIPLQISLPPKEYFPDEFELLRSFRISDGWTSDGQGSDYLYLTYGDSKLSFISPHTAYNSEVPTNTATAPEDSKDLVGWFQKHPYLDTEEPIAAKRGSLSGKQFDTTVDAPLGVGFLECVDPCAPLFQASDGSRFVLFEQHEIRTIVSAVKEQPVVITIESPTGEFDEFLPKAMRVLNTVEWQAET
jgi:hypothetical protein